MLSVAEKTQVAKKTGRPKGNRDDVTVKVARQIAAKAKLIASDRGVSVAEVLSEILESPINRAYAQMIRKLEGEQK
jgi:hypothetical protein